MYVAELCGGNLNFGNQDASRPRCAGDQLVIVQALDAKLPPV
jgi:hypothetical protein